jgi:hypothetical protein
MKKIILMTMVLMCSLVVPATAQQQTPCGSDNPCVQIPWTEMGAFSDMNGGWVWNAAFLSTIPPEDEPLWRPTKGLQVLNSRLDLRRFTNTQDTRVYLQAQELISWPIVYKDASGSHYVALQPPDGCNPADYPNGQLPDQCECAHLYPQYADPGQCNYNGPCDHCWNPQKPEMNADPNVNPCCKLWRTPNRQTAPNPGAPPFNASRVMNLTWINKNAVASSMVDQTQEMKNVPYQLFPMNFWSYSNQWQTSKGLNFYFPSVIPDVGEQTFKLTYDTNKILELKFNVTDTRPMPIVALERVTKVGVTKTNINGKVIKDGYKLTWNDPAFKEIMIPGIELRVYVGSNEPNPEIFYWIDCPSQMSKLLIPTADWDALKTKLLAAGYVQAKILITYRLNVTDPNLKSIYTNRGQSDPITVLLQ